MVLLELAALYLDGEVLWPEFVVLPEQEEKAAPARTRAYHLVRRYRVRPEDVERMVAAQHGLCEVEVSDEEMRELVRAEEELRSAFHASVSRVGLSGPGHGSGMV
ncbi:hypothetical protein [Nonomuraea maritima]|uniref:hypothetical protein n=1 Tax=Nonomuraea maritima TaxID=683260 RepID=UPI00371539FB